jgi:cytidylate kinase
MAASAPIVTIDGPSGSGKGTISRALAARLRWHLLDSGALYRLVALAATRRGNPEDPAELARLARAMDVTFGSVAMAEQVLLAGEDVTEALRTESIGAGASQVAAVPEALLQRQRDFARPPGLVADGRDMGTVVFPAADLKVFLTATADERAMRRHKQLKGKGIDVSLRDLSWDIAQRDARDASRSVAPLKPAPDARTIDSTDLTPEEVIARILQWLEAAGIGPKRA